MIKKIIALSLLALSSLAHTQEQSYARVLVLHGVWKADNWEYNYDDNLRKQLASIENANFDVSFYYLGLDSELDDAAYANLQGDVRSALNRQSVDLIVGVLPAASQFVMDLDGVDDLPKILILPDESLIAEVAHLNNVAVIANAASNAIKTTIDQILLLLPNISSIQVISGSSDNDLTFMNRAKTIANNYPGNVQFNFHVGRDPEVMLEWAAALPSTTVILTMPYESYGEVATPIRTDFRELLEQYSVVPVFGFYDSLLGNGIVGGHLSSTEGYARSTVAMSQILLREIPSSPILAEGTATTIYDWRQVKKWNLNLNRLQSDYEVYFQPPTLWETNRTLVITVTNIILMLAVVIVLLLIWLRRSKLTQARIIVSEQQARISERQYRLLAQNSADVIWTWNTETKTIDYCSPSIKRLTGFIPEQYQIKTLSEVMTPRSVTRFNQVVSKQPPTPEIIEVQHYNQNGDKIYCEIALQPAQQVGEEQNLWVAVTRDIRQRKQAERERAKLEEKVNQAQKFESLGTLAGGIAHDFNNILGIFIGVAEMLELKLNGNAPALSLVQRLRAAVDRAKGLVNQILTFSRRSSDLKNIIDLVPVLEDSLDLIKVGIPKTVKIETKLTAGTIPILANQNQIEQVILNLVTNAYEAMHDEVGEITISLSVITFAEERQCRFGLAPPGSYALLEVKDNGCGVNPSDVDKVFDPFYTNKTLGSGMGLAIVHGIVGGHSGCIDLHSTLGEGSHFSVYFPLEQNQPVKVRATDSEEINSKPLRILLVDDQRELLDVLNLLFMEMGHKCISCDDSVKALDIIEQQHRDIDFIVTDYSMPNVSGLEIVQCCKQICPTIPIIICSGYGESIPKNIQTLHEKCLLLNKPVGIKSINKAMAQLMG